MAGSRSAPIETSPLGEFLSQLQCVGVDRWGLRFTADPQRCSPSVLRRPCNPSDKADIQDSGALIRNLSDYPALYENVTALATPPRHIGSIPNGQVRYGGRSEVLETVPEAESVSGLQFLSF